MNNIKNKIDSTRTFVNTHKTQLAVAAGFVGGVAATIVTKKFLDEDKYLLDVPLDGIRCMQAGGHGVYETEFGTIYTVMENAFTQQ